MVVAFTDVLTEYIASLNAVTPGPFARSDYICIEPRIFSKLSLRKFPETMSCGTQGYCAGDAVRFFVLRCHLAGAIAISEAQMLH